MDINHAKPSDSVCKKHAHNKLFQEKTRDLLYAIIEKSETESHELDSMLKLKMHVADIKNRIKSRNR